MRHVNTRIQHVNRNSNIRFLFQLNAVRGWWDRLLEIINDRLRIAVIAGYALNKAAGMLRVKLVETLHDILCVPFVLCKDNGFANSVPAGNLDAFCHQILQHHVDSLLVEYELVYFR